jgi:hypothetical protein
MKTVRYLQGMGEPRGPGIRPGDTRKVSDEEAERLIEREIAVEHTKDDKATQETIKGIQSADEEGFEQIASTVMDEAGRRGVTQEFSASEANLVKDASDDDLVALAQNITAELAERGLEVPAEESTTKEETEVSDDEKAKEANAEEAAAKTAKSGKKGSTATSTKAAKAEKRG